MNYAVVVDYANGGRKQEAYPSWLAAQRAKLAMMLRWPGIRATVVCTGIGKEG